MLDRGRFTQIASAAVVVLSLVFVGLEVRESARQTEVNTQSLQVSAYQDLIAQIQLINLTLLENSELRIRLNENAESAWGDLSVWRPEKDPPRPGQKLLETSFLSMRGALIGRKRSFLGCHALRCELFVTP